MGSARRAGVGWPVAWRAVGDRDLPGEVAGVGAQRDPLATHPPRQPGQRPLQQAGRGGAGIVDTAAQVGGQRGLGPGVERLWK